jgi:predicted Rossmann fold nucleotide-binding protein DprA/Smf involved in DNA uptake
MVIGKYPQKVISGGQTGVDRAGLDAAIEAQFPIGGYVPKGRLAEDGIVPDKYPMTEMRTKDYKARTRQNVLESDGTLIINMGLLKSGTALTAKIVREYNKPLLIIQLDQDYEPGAVSQWINENQIEILNIAGPRESKVPGIYEKAKELLLMELLQLTQQR